MSQDLIFGFTKKNWSRTPPKAVHECGPEMCMVSYQKAPLTDDEKSKLDQLARVKMKAESGDRPAQRQWKDITLKMSSLKSKSKKGDPKAKHTLEILEDSGLFGHVQKISGIAPRAIEDDPGMDLVERMILRAGTTRGWPVYVKKQDYEDWKLRAGKGETSASSTFNIRVPVFTRGDLIGGTFVGDEERELARYGGSAEREALGRRLGKRTGSMGEHIHDADLDEDDSNSQPQGNKSQSPLLKATKGTGEVLSKGATTASQVVAVAQIASYAGRLGKKKR